jgi:hypothetical protein
MDNFCLKQGAGTVVRKAGSLKSSFADPDPGSGAFLTPGSGIRDR